MSAGATVRRGAPACRYKDKSTRTEGRPTGGEPEGPSERVEPEETAGRSEAEREQGRDRPGRRHRRVSRRAFDPVVPRSVKECHSNGGRAWWIYCWKKALPNTKTRVPYQCSSWRCPHCARREAAVTFARIRDATTPLDARGFVFLVLTLDQNGARDVEGRPRWANAQKAYSALGGMSEAFLRGSQGG